MSHWKISQDCIEALTRIEIPPRVVFPKQIIRVFEEDRIAGFYRLEIYCKHVQLSHLYVDCHLIRQGFGSRLWDDAVSKCRTIGVHKLTIISDQHAKDFYLARGAKDSSKTRPSPCGETVILTTLELIL